MKKIAVFAVSLPLLATTGCTYMENRGRDAADIFNVSAVSGIGVSAQVAPVNLVLLQNQNLVGLEDGAFYKSNEFAFFDDSPNAPGGRGGMLFVNGFMSQKDDLIKQRGKDSEEYTNFFGFIPYPGCCSGTHYPKANYWTKVEVSAALGVGVKVGVNPGELLDFFLGWFGVDIYGDDIAGSTDRSEVSAHKSVGK